MPAYTLPDYLPEVHYRASRCSPDVDVFGIGDASNKYVGRITVAAPEIVVDGEGNGYITSNHNLAGGTILCRHKWEKCSTGI